MKHTPAPWNVEAPGDWVSIQYGKIRLAPLDRKIPKAEREANAKIIALAPEFATFIKDFLSREKLSLTVEELDDKARAIIERVKK
jgi:hypothetical protein